MIMERLNPRVMFMLVCAAITLVALLGVCAYYYVF